MGPRTPHSAGLTALEEAAVVEFRRRTLLPLDDVLGALREALPALSRSALHRCLLRHGISRLPEAEGGATKRGRFADTTLGYVHIDACELRSAKGKVHRRAHVPRHRRRHDVHLRRAAGSMHPRATMMTGAAFLRGVVAAFPYAIHTVLTDNGVAFTDCAATKWDYRVHVFDRVCRTQRITHKFTRPYHPWTNGQAERMHRTVKDATVRSFHYDTRADLQAHIAAFVTAFDFAKHLKALRWRTRFQAICDAWTKDPTPFKSNPHHLILGPYT